MRKLFALFLIFYGVAAGPSAPKAAAQFNIRLDFDLNTRLMSLNTPTGERAQKLISINGVTGPNINSPIYNPNGSPPGSVAGGIPVPRGDYFYSSGSLDLFNYYRFTSGRENEVRLGVEYSNPNVAFLARFSLDNLVRANANPGGGGNALSGGHSLVQGSGRTPNWGDVLRYSFVDWYARGNFQFLTFYAGNVGDRGKVRYFQNFSHDLLRAVILDDGFHVNTPVNNSADYLGNGQDINNVMRSISSENEQFRWVEVPYFSVSARIDNFGFPLTVQLVADVGNNVFTAPAPGDNYLGLNGSVRISGENIKKRVTFDAIYKFKGGDKDILDSYDLVNNPGGTLQPDGKGITAHAFGVFANILEVPKFGIGFGYSGYLRVYEDNEKTGVSRNSPLFSGIDLRAAYSGIPKTTITVHNNISFTNVNESNDDKIKKVGVWGQELSTGYSQSWFALYNAVSYQYRPDSRLTLSLQAANRLGIVSTTAPFSGVDVTVKKTHLRLGGGGQAAFQFHSNFLIQGGCSLLWVNNSYSNSAEGAQKIASTRNASGGTFEISIPIRMRLIFRP